MSVGHGSETLVHQALIYSSPGEFVAEMVPFVREGQERGDPVFAATSRRNIDALREALGPDAEGVDFRDSREWYRQPYRTLAAYSRYVDQHADGNVVRVIGEPVGWAVARFRGRVGALRVRDQRGLRGCAGLDRLPLRRGMPARRDHRSRR